MIFVTALSRVETSRVESNRVKSSHKSFFPKNKNTVKNNAKHFKKSITKSTTMSIVHNIIEDEQSDTTARLNLWQVSWTEAAGGAAAGAVADAVLYGVDSAKVRAQTAPVVAEGVGILFRGLGPTILLGSVPVFGSFFFLYAPFKSLLQERHAEAWLPLASAICAIPATVVGVPADVLKKRLVLGMDPTVATAIRTVVAQDGIYRGLFAAWHVNLIRDIPFAGAKIGLYEWFVVHYKTRIQRVHKQERVTVLGSSICGVLSGVTCAVLTCPLDVVNTRIKADSTTSHSTSIQTVAQEIVEREGVKALFRGVAFRSLVLGLGSSIFWPIQRTVSHALQSSGDSPI
jgi:solute carrier family 25 (mitochondrial iron transporter), member 28/37